MPICLIHLKITSKIKSANINSNLNSTTKCLIHRISESEFMEYSEIENHDDFYSVDDKEFIHVQDHRVFY